MSDKVVSLHGTPVPTQNEPNPTLINELEQLLAAARSGEIVGLAGAYVRSDRITHYVYAGQVDSYGLIGGLECVKERLVRLATE